MATSLLVPSVRGFLAVAALFANALVIPALVPAYDGPGFRPLHGVIAVILGVLTAAVCLRCFQRSRVADKVAGVLSLLFAFWMFYVLLDRIF